MVRLKKIDPMMKFNYLKVVLSTFILMFMIMGCSSAKGTEKGNGKLETVSVATFDKGLKIPGVQILDVRTADEFAEGHIKGAMNIDVFEPDFQAVATEKLSKENPVYVYCRSGRRSLMAGEILSKDGYDVTDLDGGILAWERAGMPVSR